MKVIELIIAPDGDIRLETRGFQGADCRAASQFLEQALGHITSNQATAEHRLTDSAHTDIGQHAG